MRQVYAGAIAALLVAVCAPVWAEERGECNADSARQSLRLDYIATTRKEGESTVTVTLPCTNEVVEVKTCAIAATQKRNSQRYCYPPDGKPQYFEYTDRLEYWEARERAVPR